jgi:hypothetical protein
MSSGLERYRRSIHDALYADIASWRGHPELSALLETLESITDADQFSNALAEAMVAHHLLRHGCDLRFEVRTPSGRSCDFEVRLDGQLFYLHVKRISTERPTEHNLTVSSRLRYLERIERPYVVSIRWHDGLTDSQMQRLVTSAAAFISHARVGDELTVRDEQSRELGGCRIVAPWEGSHVTLAIGLPWGFNDETPRIHKLLRKAYQQFMPKATNVILIGSRHEEDAADLETALLGAHIERWDAAPPRGQRIAHGRAADGFWADNQFRASSVAGWFAAEPGRDQLRSRLWFRGENGLDHNMRHVLRRLLDES